MPRFLDTRFQKLGAALALATAVLLSGGAAHAIGFSCISGNNTTQCGIGEAQFSATLANLGAGLVSITFANSGPTASFIAQVYIDDDAGVFAGIASITNRAGHGLRKWWQASEFSRWQHRHTCVLRDNQGRRRQAGHGQGRRRPRRVIRAQSLLEDGRVVRGRRVCARWRRASPRHSRSGPGRGHALPGRQRELREFRWAGRRAGAWCNAVVRSGRARGRARCSRSELNAPARRRRDEGSVVPSFHAEHELLSGSAPSPAYAKLSLRCRISSMNSARVLGSRSKAPRIELVMAKAFCCCDAAHHHAQVDRLDDHRHALGLEHASRASPAICGGEALLHLEAAANISTRRGIFESPTTLPVRACRRRARARRTAACGARRGCRSRCPSRSPSRRS